MRRRVTASEASQNDPRYHLNGERDRVALTPDQPRNHMSTTMTICPAQAVVTGLIPMAHAESVERSIAFYERFGFAVENSIPDHLGKLTWAAMKSALAQIMFARASGPVDPTQQAILFYLYTDDLRALRQHLLDCGVPNLGGYHGCERKCDGRGGLYDIAHPPYMPSGEMRVEDPDGYCLLVGQLT